MITEEKTEYQKKLFIYGLRLLFILFMLFLTIYAKAESFRNDAELKKMAQTIENFQHLLDSLRIRYGFPGATAAYVLPDGKIVSVSTGIADKEAEGLITSDSRMLIASIGKTFVGALAAVLADERAIQLDAPLSIYLGSKPWFYRLPYANEITLRQLLNHTSGLPDHVYMKEFADDVAQKWAEPENYFTNEKLVQYILDQPALFEPGKGWSYSDTGYILAGMAIEASTRQELFEMIEDRFLKPFKLHNTSPSDDRHLPGLVPGYTGFGKMMGIPEKTTDHNGMMQWHPAMEGAGGGLISNSHDLALWGWLLYGGKAVAPSALDEILNTAPVTSVSEAKGYGLGVSIDLHGEFGPVYGHGGWIPGYCSSLRYYPEQNIAIAFQINTDIGIMDSDVRVTQIIEEQLAGFVSGNLKKF
jgi:D-alanyl-D-alanine carboxypeptidase